MLFRSRIIQSIIHKNKEDETILLKEKINTELSYIDGELISIANGLNNISYSKYTVTTKEVENISGETQQSKSEEGSNEKNANASSQGNLEEPQQEDEDKSSNQEKTSQSTETSNSQTQSSSKTENSNNKQKSSSNNEVNQIYSLSSNNILVRKNEIDWEEFQSKIETIYTVLTVVLLDLKEAGISESDINDFSNSIDLLTVSIKNKQKDETLNNIMAVYEFLPRFIKVYDGESKEQEIISVKYNLLLCYKDVSLNEWDILENDLASLKLRYSNIENKNELFEGKYVNIQSGAIIVEELKNSIEIRDSDIFFIKYKSLIQELNIIGSI